MGRKLWFGRGGDRSGRRLEASAALSRRSLRLTLRNLRGHLLLRWVRVTVSLGRGEAYKVSRVTRTSKTRRTLLRRRRSAVTRLRVTATTVRHRRVHVGATHGIAMLRSAIWHGLLGETTAAAKATATTETATGAVVRCLVYANDAAIKPKQH